MSNAFANSLNDRHAFEVTASKMKDANLKKLQKAARIASTDTSNTLLVASNVDVDFANASVIENKRVDVYALEKMMNFVFCAQFMSDNMNEVNEVIFVRMRQHVEAKRDFSKDDAIDALNDHKSYSISTIAAQYRSTIAALEMLNIISKSTNDALKTVYKVDTENAIYVALCEQFDAR